MGKEKLEKIMQNCKFDFAKVAELIDLCLNSLRGANDKPVVLLLGTSGVGKSTLSNYFLGCNYQKVRNNRGAVVLTPTADSIEVTATSDSVGSKTLFPKIIEIPNEPYNLCDLGGINDTRGIEEKILIANSLQIIQKTLEEKAPGILLLVPFSKMDNRASELLNDYLDLIGNIFPENIPMEKVQLFIDKKIRFVVTGGDGKRTIEHARACFQELQQEIRKKPENRARQILSYLLQSELNKSPIVMNFLDPRPEGREELRNAISQLLGDCEQILQVDKCLQAQKEFNEDFLLDFEQAFRECQEDYSRMREKLEGLNKERARLVKDESKVFLDELKKEASGPVAPCIEEVECRYPITKSVRNMSGTPSESRYYLFAVKDNKAKVMFSAGRNTKIKASLKLYTDQRFIDKAKIQELDSEITATTQASQELMATLQENQGLFAAVNQMIDLLGLVRNTSPEKCNDSERQEVPTPGI